MKRVYNWMIYLDALNKYIDLTFVYDESDEIYSCSDYYLYEAQDGLFDLYLLRYDPDTGGHNEFLRCERETLADIIDRINNEMNYDDEGEF